MRGHARGPFNNLNALDSLPVLRVQKQVKLLPGSSFSFQIQASTDTPVLAKMLVNVQAVSTSGTNILRVGTAATPDLYIAAGDVDETTLGFNTEKKFLFVENTTLIAELSAAGISASKALTISAITGANTQTVTIGGQTYTFLTSFVDAANNVLIGADATAMGANLAAAINGAAGAGTTYGTGTVANASVTASAAAGVVTVTARLPGTAGNSIAISETLTNGAWAGGATTLSGGANADATGSMWLLIDA